MTTTTETPAASAMLTIVFHDGHRETIDLDSPVALYQASFIPAPNETVERFNMLWCAAGRPGIHDYASMPEAVEAWLGLVKGIEDPDDPPTMPESPG